jgi:hypothetical protein
MAAQSTLPPPPPAPTGRYIRIYLLIWGILAAGGLGYLASLAWQPDLLARPAPQQSESDEGLRVAKEALAEVGSVRHQLDDVQRDLGQVREVIDQREVTDKAVQSRISALEERATAPPAAAAAEPPERAKAPEKAAEDKGRKPNGARAPLTPASSQNAPPIIETGSIGGGSPTITFGAPVVTPSKRAVYGVQLAAGPSLDALRVSWNTLLERHAAALGPLQPRVAFPRAVSGPYRLLAGPLATKADADKVCADMGIGRQNCFSTMFTGEPL